jgi:hypothetical protein
MKEFIIFSTKNPACSYFASWEEVVERARYSVERAKMLGTFVDTGITTAIVEFDHQSDSMMYCAAQALAATGWTLAQIVS